MLSQVTIYPFKCVITTDTVSQEIYLHMVAQKHSVCLQEMTGFHGSYCYEYSEKHMG